MNLRFREWGSTEWTYVHVSGELEAEAKLALCNGLRHYHVQEQCNGGWENL